MVGFLEKIRRWQWALIGVLLGYAYAEVRLMGGAVDPARLGPSSNDQAAFEKALVTQTDGVAHFTDLTVYPASNGQQIVAGRVYDAKPRRIEREGETVWVTGWSNGCFVLQLPFKPYAPARKNESAATVAEYLKNTPGVTYRSAWWADKRWARIVPAAVGLAFFGLVWPTLFNLLHFGQWSQPAREGIAKLAASRGRAAVAISAEEDDAELESLTAHLETSLADDGASKVTAGVQAVVTQVPRVLGGGGEAPRAVPKSAPGEFGAADDDFYPTERHAQPTAKKKPSAGQVSSGGGGSNA